jgi:hypothetical protein
MSHTSGAPSPAGGSAIGLSVTGARPGGSARSYGDSSDDFELLKKQVKCVIRHTRKYAAQPSLMHPVVA